MRDDEAADLESVKSRWRDTHEVLWLRYKNSALRLVKVPCGKPNCSRCPHGPYWYLVLWRGKRPVQKYIGRRLYSKRLERDTMMKSHVDRIVAENHWTVPPEEREV